MAQFNWEVYSDTPAWKDVQSNTIVFAGSLTDLTVPITVGSWNGGTHLGSGDPGTDQCGTNHARNIEYVSSTEFKMNGGSTETISNGNLADTDCTLRVKFTDAVAVTISNGRFYTFDGTVVTNEAVGIEAYAVEAQVGASTWTKINDDTGDIGGDNTGERLTLSDQSSNTQHFWYIALSARPQSVGAKTQFDVGIALTYS